MPSAVSIVVSLRTATAAGLIDLHRTLARLEADAGTSEKALKSFRGAAVGLTPALVPIAAQLAPIAAGFAAAGVAVGAFGAAVAPQIKTMGDAVKAQQKATDATVKYGAASTQAVAAQKEYQASLAKMPPATQRASAAYMDLTKSFKAWSDATAADTMPVLTKGMADLGAVLPHLTPLVEGTSAQLDRLVTIAGGELSTPGFDKLAGRFDAFANGVVKKATDEVVHFARALSEGSATGPLTKLMDYARQNGPQVRETLKDLGVAVAHVGEAAASAGPGMLTIVDALAKLVGAVPPEVLTRLVQLYTAFKLIKLGSAGLVLVGGQVGAFTRSLTGMARASAAAGGGAAGVRAAFATLSTGTKVAGAIAVIAGIALALKSLGGSGKAAPDVAKMTTAIGELGRTGSASGELTKAFGANLDGLGKEIEKVNGKKDGLDHFNDVMNAVFTLGMKGSNAPKKATQDIGAIDKSLANLVSGGHADLAAAALKRLTDQYAKAGKPTSDLTSKLDNYKSALADAKFESELTADSQGLFGRQAEEVQKKLDAQKASADGLRQSIQALNDVNRAGLNAQSDFEQAIDDATKAIKDHRTALKGNSNELDLNAQGARDAYAALSNLAEKTDAATAAARDQGRSWDVVSGIYERGRTNLINTAVAMGRTKEQAKALAEEILKAPDKTAFLKGNLEDLQKKLDSAKKQLGRVPKSKTVAIRGNVAQIENQMRDVQAEINALHGKEIVIRATYSIVGGKGMNVFHEGGGYASGGRVVGPGSGTSDDVPIWASNGEFVVNARGAAKHKGLLEAINNGDHGMAAFAKGGAVSKAQAEAQARASDWGQFGISHFGQMAGYRTSPFTRSTGAPGDIGSLVSTLNDWRQRIAAATHGAQESKLLHALDGFGAQALKNESALEKVNTQLDGAKNKLSTLQDSFAQLRDGISSSIVSFGSIAKQGGGGPLGQVSVGEQLRQSVGSAQEFAADLAALKKKGLNAQSLSEIAQAGIEGGGLETAQRLLGSNPGQIKEINDLEKQLIAAGKTAGTTTADAMYGGGLKAAEALVKGLEKSQKRIEGVMTAAADAMARELKRAFGIGARKGAGGVVGAAATGGPRWGRTLVGEYGAEIADLPAGTMVHSAGDSARMLAGGGGLSEMHITVMIGDAVLGELSIDPLRKAIRRQGGNVQAVLGVRGKG